MDPKEYAGKPRDSVRESELADRLRQLESNDAFDFVMEYIELDYRVGLNLANRCLREPDVFERILRRGLEIADASTIRFWLECCLPRLGAARLIQVLQQSATELPEAVEKSLYWLDSLIQERSQNLERMLADLRQSIAIQKA